MWIRGGGKNAYAQNVDKKHVFFLTLPLPKEWALREEKEVY